SCARRKRINSRSSATAVCNCSTERRLLQIFSMGFRSGFLRENQDQCDNHDQECERRSVTTQSQAPFPDRLIKKIADRGSERASQNEGSPKQDDARKAREVVKKSGQQK